MSLKNRIAKLTDSERSELHELLLNRNAAGKKSLEPESGNGNLEVVAFLNHEKEKGPLNTEELRAKLSQRLPNYMVPKHFVSVESFPLSPNGKIDRKKLSLQDAVLRLEPKFDGLKNFGVIHTLREIWERTLGISNFDDDANFFELGGDSITAIQFVSSARERQIPLTISKVFQFPILRELSNSLGEASNEGHVLSNSEADRNGTNEHEIKILNAFRKTLNAPSLTPTDDFFASGGDSLSAIQLVSDLRTIEIEVSVSQLFKFSSASELSKVINPKRSGGADSAPEQDSDGDLIPFSPIQEWFYDRRLLNKNHWNQSILLELDSNVTFDSFKSAFTEIYAKFPALRLRIDENPTRLIQKIKPHDPKRVPCELVSISNLEAVDSTTAITEKANLLHSSMDLGEGSLLRAAFFKSGNGTPPKALLVAHHFCVDAVSWTKIVNEIRDLISENKPRGYSNARSQDAKYKAWFRALSKQANSNWAQSRIDFWKYQIHSDFARIPLDLGTEVENTEGSCKVITVSFSKEITKKLDSVSHRSSRPLNLILLASLSHTLKEWLKEPSLLIGMEGHGREPIDNDLDPHSLVGWFTSYFPLFLDLSVSHTQEETLDEVINTFKSIPDSGRSFGAIRYLRSREDSECSLANAPEPEVIFNFLGRLQPSIEGSLRVLSRQVGAARDARNKRTSLFEIDSYIEDKQLKIDWNYSGSLHRKNTIKRLSGKLSDQICRFANELQTVAQSQERSSNLPLRWPLNDGQQSLLFHHLGNKSKDHGNILFSCDIEGSLDETQTTLAWSNVVKAFPALRSTVSWGDSTHPHLVCHELSQASLSHLDYSNQPPDTVHSSIEKFEGSERSKNLDLTSLPNHYATLIKVAHRHYKFYWRGHHIFADGWSGSIILNRFIQEINNPKRVLENETESISSGYYHWLSNQSVSLNKSVWRHLLSTAKPTLLANGKVGNKPERGSHSESRARCEKFTEAGMLSSLKEQAHQFGVTPSTLVIAAWSLCLGTLAKKEQICFGLVHSGRNLPVSKPEAIVGNLANAVPFPVTLPQNVLDRDWLRSLLELQELTSRYSHREVPKFHPNSHQDKPLYDTLLTIANYPGLIQTDNYQLSNYVGDTTSSLPLSITVGLENRIEITADYLEKHHNDVSIQRILDTFVTVLEQIRNGSVADREPFVEESPKALDQEPINLANPEIKSASLSLQIRDFMREVINAPDLCLEEDFFAAGGSSMQAVRLIGRINDHYKLSLPVSSLLKYSTPQSLADYLDEYSQPNTSFKHLIKIQDGGDFPPLFLVHSGGTQVLFYRQLAEAIDSRLPVWVIQPKGHDGNELPDESIPAMASRYMEEILSVCPHGPRLVAGHCFGAAIAIEIGKQVQNKGLEQPYIISLDGEAPQTLGYKLRKSERILRGDLTPYKAYRILRRIVTGTFEKLTDDWFMKHGTSSKRHEIVLRKMQKNYLHAYRSYTTTPFSGETLALRCLDSDFHPNHSAEDWKRAAPNAEILELSCRHSELLEEPFVRSTAEVIISKISEMEEYKNLSSYIVSDG